MLLYRVNYNQVPLLLTVGSEKPGLTSGFFRLCPRVLLTQVT